MNDSLPNTNPVPERTRLLPNSRRSLNNQPQVKPKKSENRRATLPFSPSTTTEVPRKSVATPLIIPYINTAADDMEEEEDEVVKPATKSKIRREKPVVHVPSVPAGHEGDNEVNEEETEEEKKKRKRIFWTENEVAALEKGMRKFGTSWVEIMHYYGPQGIVNNSLANKTAGQLKDKARTERRRRIKLEIPLGPFHLATI